VCFVWLPKQATIISPANAAFDSKLDLNLKKILVKYCIRSTAVCGAETGADVRSVRDNWKVLKFVLRKGGSVGPIV
jgi:hypothetical protein